MAARSRKQQSEAEANGGEIAQLKHERQQHQGAINRCVCVRVCETLSSRVTRVCVCVQTAA